MAKKLKAAVIGCGAIAQHCHLKGYAAHPDVSLVAAADITQTRLEEAKSEFKVKNVYLHYEEMLEKEDLDLVSVCTPNYLHADCVIQAARAGCHVLCEKPMALTLDDANQMIETVRTHNVRMMIGFTHRFMKGNQAAKQLIEKDSIGRPFMIRVRFAHEGPEPDWAMSEWFYVPQKSGGGAGFDMGIHAMDLCQFYMGPVKSVQANIKTVVKDIRVDDNAVLLFEFTSGSLGYMEAGWTSKPGFTGCEIYGTEGTIIVDYTAGLRVIRGSSSAAQAAKTGESETIDVDVTAGGWDVEIEHFVKKPFLAGPAEGLSSLRVALAGYESSKTGQKVVLED